MESAEFFAEGLVRGKLIAVDGCPGLVPRTWGGFVRGEIYRLTNAQREQIGDREVRATGEEKAKDHFQQVLLEAIPHHEGREAVRAWGWKWTGPESDCYPEVESGDWMDRPMTQPWCTWIGLICLLFFPVGLMAEVYLSRLLRGTVGDLVEDCCLILVIVSPFAGFLAVYLGHRRRESKATMRGIVTALLGITAIFALRFLASLVSDLSRWFR
jgi:hypothetical protein